MKRFRNIIFSPVLLILVAFGSYHWANVQLHSLIAYASPLVDAVFKVEDQTTPPMTDRVVLVIVSGMSYQAMLDAETPIWQTLRKSGASAPVGSRPPGYWQSAWTTLMTGVWPDLNNAPVVEVDSTNLPPIALDHIFLATRDAGLRTAISGSAVWEKFLPIGTADATFLTSEIGVIPDGQVVQMGLGFIGDPQYNLILIQLSQLRTTGQEEGTDSQAYAGASQQIDSHLRQITRQMNLSESVLIVTSDVALLDGGQSAGGEPDPPYLPFVMVGENVIAGSFSPVQQTDLAPTITTLLGVRLPTTAQGRLTNEMLLQGDDADTLNQLALAQQKVNLSESYLEVIGGETENETTRQDLLTAQQSQLSGNLAGSRQLAQLVVEEAADDMDKGKDERIEAERLPRLIISLLVLVLLPLVFWRLRRPPQGLLCGVGAISATIIFYAIYRLSGHSFAFSDMAGNPDTFVQSLYIYGAVALASGGLLVLLGLLHGDQRRFLAAVSIVYDYGLFASYLAAILALLIYWRQGATIQWYLPDLRVVVLQQISLRHLTVTAALGIVLPWFVALISWGVGQWRNRADTRTKAWDSIAYLRRR